MKDNAGNAALEFAFAFGIFGTPMLLGSSELALLIYDSIEVSNSAHAGAMYGMMSSTFAADTAGIQKAAQAEAADFGTNVTVTPTNYYACSSAVDGTQYATQAAASAVCPANASNHYLQFVKVVSNMSITPPVQFPGLPKTWTVSGSSVMEVQE
ncbi:MAG: TadE/TadG family type IV pilus assembly protein [Limisphaerales bacterium]